MRYRPQRCDGTPDAETRRRFDAIRRALPNPPVHARNLFHTSVAMWDAWAVYDPTASGYLVKEKHTASDVAAARNEASCGTGTWAVNDADWLVRRASPR